MNTTMKLSIKYQNKNTKKDQGCHEQLLMAYSWGKGIFHYKCVSRTMSRIYDGEFKDVKGVWQSPKYAFESRLGENVFFKRHLILYYCKHQSLLHSWI